jgi:hypothetical protein
MLTVGGVVIVVLIFAITSAAYLTYGDRDD